MSGPLLHVPPRPVPVPDALTAPTRHRNPNPNRNRDRHRHRDQVMAHRLHTGTNASASISIREMPLLITASPLRRQLAAVLACLALLPAAGCEKAMQDMYQQPKYGPLEPSDLFPNGNSSRTPPDGSLVLVTGGFAESSGGRLGTQVPLQEHLKPVHPILEKDVPRNSDDGAGPWVPDLSSLPVQVTAATLQHGQERFRIFCTPCHGLTGDGDGIVVQRGFPAPPSYHSERLRTAPNSHFYNVITQGYGAMYPYNDRVPQQDRWAIVAYIRALQLSRHAPVGLLAGADRRRLESGHD